MRFRDAQCDFEGSVLIGGPSRSANANRQSEAGA